MRIMHPYICPVIINGKEHIEDIRTILYGKGVERVFLVAGSTYEKTDLPEFFASMPIEFVRFSAFTPNPKYEEVLAALELFRESCCDFIISVGGGSAIDVAKAVALYSAMEPETDYLNQEIVPTEIEHLAIPTTAGTGSEAGENIVFYVNGNKHSLYHYSCIPRYVFLNPEYLKSMPERTKKASLADAICHSVESILAQKATDESISYASQALTLLLNNVAKYLRGDESVYADIQMGAFKAGQAISISKTVAGHAMAYKLTSICGLPHGEACSFTLPSILASISDYLLNEYGVESMRSKKIVPEIRPLAEKMCLLCKLLGVGDNSFESAGKQLDFIFRYIDMPGLSYPGEDAISELVDNINIERMANHPLKYTKEQLAAIYMKSFGKTFDENGDIIDDPDVKAARERLEFVRGLQKLTLETLLLTKEFLDEQGLRFYLGEGTLLGAVRHKGFIPWDDDIDILMPREDYDKLIELDKEGLIPPELNLDALENNDSHWVLGAKMQLTRETEYVQEKVCNLSKYCGPYVDIFPLDVLPEFKKPQMKSYRKVKICRRLLFMSTGYSTAIRRKPHRMILRLISLVVPNKWIERYAVKHMKKFSKSKPKYFINHCSYYPYHKEIFLPQQFGNPVMLPFEGHLMPVPRQYDAVLRIVYGSSYDTLPPFTVAGMRKHAFELKK